MGKYKAKYYKKLYKETLGELKSCKENQELNDPISMTDEITHPSLLYN